MKAIKEANMPGRNAVDGTQSKSKWTIKLLGSIALTLVVIILAFVSVSDGAQVSPKSNNESVRATT